MSRPVKINPRQFKIGKDGKIERQVIARDASHAIALKKSKRQRVVRRTAGQ